MLLVVPEVVLEGVNRLSGLDFQDSSRLSAPDILWGEDVGPNSGEATVGDGNQDSFAFFPFSPALALNGIWRRLPGVCGCLSRSLCFPSCFGLV